MSEDDGDDRMDRARRIRRMREGDDRPDEDDDTDDAAELETEATADTGDDHETASEDHDDSAGHTDATAETTDADEEDSETGETTVDDESEMEWGSPGGEQAATQTDPGHGDHEESAEGAENAPETPGSGEESEGISAPLPGADQLEEALEESGTDAEAETVAPDEVGADDEGDETEEETRVLEFTLHDEHYCLDIEYIEEIVKQETITRVPNTPTFVEGVVDLRGQITTILNPKVTIGKADETAGDLIVVFDEEAFEDQGYIGWVVDDVRQVSLITDGDVNDPPVEQAHIQGVIDREDEDEFVIWTTPDLVFDEAED